MSEYRNDRVRELAEIGVTIGCCPVCANNDDSSFVAAQWRKRWWTRVSAFECMNCNAIFEPWRISTGALLALRMHDDVIGITGR